MGYRDSLFQVQRNRTCEVGNSDITSGQQVELAQQHVITAMSTEEVGDGCDF